MKSTAEFKSVIQNYLEIRAIQDELFAVSFAKEGKNIDDCINYILDTVHKSGCNGFADDEIFSMAVHYYDEDNILISNDVSKCNVVINHAVELSEEEKAEVKAAAMKKAIDEQYVAMTAKNKPVKKVEVVEQTSLF